jgi:hypothetical protein
MDSKEDKVVLDDQGKLQDLVSHAGWGVARKKFVERILELQSVSEYTDFLDRMDPTKLLIAMKVDKKVAEVLYDFLAEIEGTAQQGVESAVTNKKSYIYKK